MGRSWLSMALMGHRFKRAGYQPLLFGYNPRKQTLDELSEGLLAFIRQRVQRPEYHLVGHSLGNIIARHSFRHGFPEGLKRLVMLAPPNGPSELAGMFKDLALYQRWTGDSGQKLADAEFYQELPIPSVEFGVIAGDKGHRIGFEDENDGVVRVTNTQLAGMKDWATVHHTHTFIMMSQDTFELCKRFLETGSFKENQTAR